MKVHMYDYAYVSTLGFSGLVEVMTNPDKSILRLSTRFKSLRIKSL